MKPKYNPISRSIPSPWTKENRPASTPTIETQPKEAVKPVDAGGLNAKANDWNRVSGGGYTSRQGSHRHPPRHQPHRSPYEEAKLAASARARMELEALFSREPSPSESKEFHGNASVPEPTREERTRITLNRSSERAAEPHPERIAGVTVMRRRGTGLVQEPRLEAVAPTQQIISLIPEPMRQGKTHTIIKALSANGPQPDETEGARSGDVLAGSDDESYKPFGSKSLRAVNWPNARVATDINSARARLKHLEPLQALAWLLLTSRADLKPLGAEEVDEKIRHLLENTPREQFTEIKPCSYWVVDPLSEISFNPSGDTERVRPVNAEGQYVHAHKLPGDIGAWVTPQRLSSAEAARKPAHAQRINAISLAGLLIASDRFDVLERVEPLDIDPLKPAASLGFDRSDMSKARNGFDIGEVNGYAVGLLAHANHFFQWINPWQPLLKEQIGLRRNELTTSLALGLKTWSLAHGELGQTCAEMVCTMLQLGAMINESGLSALCAQAVKSSGKAGPAAGFARLCAQMFLVDRQGIAAQRVLQSARAGGFSVMPQTGQAHPMVPYAQANLVDAVALMLREGMNPLITDGMGKNVLQRAQSTRAERVVELLETGRLPESEPQAAPMAPVAQPASSAPAPVKPAPVVQDQTQHALEFDAPSEQAGPPSAGDESRLATQAESDAMLSQAKEIQARIDTMRGMPQALEDLISRAPEMDEGCTTPPVQASQVLVNTRRVEKSGSVAGESSRKNTVLRTEAITPQDEEVATASFAVNSKIKPSARRRAALEELRAEFARAREHA